MTDYISGHTGAEVDGAITKAIKLPTIGGGDAGKAVVVKNDESGYEFIDVPGGFYKSIAIIADVKAYNVDGGTFTDGADRTRDLNTIISDADSIVSLSANVFTLQAGTYTIMWVAPCNFVYHNSSWIYNDTDAAVEGKPIQGYATSGQHNAPTGRIITTITAAKDFKVLHRGDRTQSTNGFGFQSKISGKDSIYTMVTILKHS